MPSEATQILSAMSRGDHSSTPRLMEIVYDDFRRLARSYVSRRPPNQSLEPTAVVHEAFPKLVNQDGVDWHGRSHFFAVGATAMRQILVDHARRRTAAKRGGGCLRISLDEKFTMSPQRDEDILALARIVELRFYGGLTIDEIVEVTGMPRRTVQRKWEATRMWLHRQLCEEPQ